VVDAIITASKVVRLERKYFQPKGIIWEKIAKGQLDGMPLLYELQRVLNKKNSLEEKSNCTQM
jgi:hypothetical protein